MSAVKRRLVPSLLGLWISIAFLAFSWRAALPNNQHRSTDLRVFATTSSWVLPPGMSASNLFTQTPKILDGYHDAVSIVTAHNFQKNGFLRTHLLPNRRGAPLASFYDRSGTQCDSSSAPTNVLEYAVRASENDVRRRPMTSLNNECIHTHYPPLGDWVFGLMATVGLDRYTSS
jgi:hypothetical protein